MTSKPVPNQLTISGAIYARAIIDSPAIASSLGGLAPALGLLNPPYNIVVPDSSDEMSEIALVSAQQFWVRLDSRARFRAWSKADSDVVSIVEAGLQELEARICAWNLVEAEGKSGVLGSIWDVYLAWGAKRIVWLAKEIEMRKNGLDEYMKAQERGLLPAQHLYQRLEEDDNEETVDGEDLFDEKYA